MILMSHPQHGMMHCYTPQDVEYNKQHGWVIVEPKKPDVKPVQVESKKREVNSGIGVT